MCLKNVQLWRRLWSRTKPHSMLSMLARILIVNCFYFDLKFIFFSDIVSFFSGESQQKMLPGECNTKRIIHPKHLPLVYACAWVWVRVCEWDAIWNWVLDFVCKTASTDDVMLCISNEMFQCAFMNCISPLRLTLAFSVDFIGKSHFDDFFMNAQIVVS